MSMFNNLGVLQQLMAPTGTADIQFLQTADLTSKQSDSTNILNSQTAFDSALSLDSLLNATSGSSGLNFSGLTSMMPQMNSLNAFGFGQMPGAGASGVGGFSFGQMPGVNFTGLGMAPLDLTSTLFGMAGFGMAGAAASGTDASASGGVDLTSLLGFMGFPAMYGTTGTTTSTDSQTINSLIKKMPLVSAAKIKEIATKPIETKVMTGGINRNASLISEDDSQLSLLNTSLPTSEDKTAFVQQLSTDINEEVRLAERGASKEVVAEVFAKGLYALYIKNHPNAEKGWGNAEETAKRKELLLTGLKNICLGNVDTQNSNNKLSESSMPEGVQEAFQILPGLSNKESNPNNSVDGGIGNNGWRGNKNPIVQLLQQTTNDLTATARENLIQRNSMA